jgi:hypothetical protein
MKTVDRIIRSKLTDLAWDRTLTTIGYKNYNIIVDPFHENEDTLSERFKTADDLSRLIKLTMKRDMKSLKKSEEGLL